MAEFAKPDERTIKRMTVFTLSTLIDTLKAQRKALTDPFDAQIKFYEDLKAKKEEEKNAKTTG